MKFSNNVMIMSLSAVIVCVLWTRPVKGECDLWESEKKYGQCKECKAGQHQKLNNPSKCEPCPDGQVRGADGKADEDCADAENVCFNWEYAKGECKECKKGEHHVEGDWTTCSPCPDGQVRGADGKADEDCADATNAGPCKLFELAKDGRCQKCSMGNHHGVGDDWTTCSPCPDGQVRGADGKADEDCADATDAGPCKLFELAKDGRCQKCSLGNHHGVGDDWTICSPCPDGQVRGADGKTDEDCADATNAGPCLMYQLASGGRCRPCPVGEHHEVDWTTCSPCPDGQVRGADGKADEDCADATNAGPCERFHQATGGKCRMCERGKQHKGNVWTHCDFCPEGRVRGEDGIAEDQCRCAERFCLMYQFGSEGRCQKCSQGEHHAGEDWTKCEVCPAGFVRGRNGREEQDCEPAYLECESYEVSENGKCSKCSAGQWRATTTCEPCAPGYVRGVDGQNEGECVPDDLFCTNGQIGRSGRCRNPLLRHD
jgi:hypothetical protein